MSRDFAIDLGTVTTQVFARGQGLILEEPTVTTVNARGEVVGIGRLGLQRYEQAPEKYEVVWPVRHGAVSEPQLLGRFLRRLMQPCRGGFFGRMRIVLTVPSNIGPTEQRVLREAGKAAGATSVYLLPQAMAGALGADLPVHEPQGNMVVDIGAGSTEAAVLALGCIVSAGSARFGGADVNVGIQDLLRRSWRMSVSEAIAEELKVAVSSAPASVALEATGTTVATGSPMTAILERKDLQDVLAGHFSAIKEAIRLALVEAPPELAQDVIARGMVLVGGGARTAGLSDALTAEFAIPSFVPPSPEHVVGIGAYKCLEALDSLRDVFLNDYV